MAETTGAKAEWDWELRRYPFRCSNDRRQFVIRLLESGDFQLALIASFAFAEALSCHNFRCLGFEVL